MGHSRRFDRTTATSPSTPVNGHSQDRRACLKGAISELMRRSKQHLYSIPSGANEGGTVRPSVLPLPASAVAKRAASQYPLWTPTASFNPHRSLRMTRSSVSHLGRRTHCGCKLQVNLDLGNLHLPRRPTPVKWTLVGSPSTEDCQEQTAPLS
jgi:hypothetical protein